jgi:tyrosyl-tRNA synthetase
VSDIIDELSWRGLIAVSTDLDDLRKALDTGIVTFYCGFDPTAPGLHIGNLVQLLTCGACSRLDTGRSPSSAAQPA